MCCVHKGRRTGTCGHGQTDICSFFTFLLFESTLSFSIEPSQLVTMFLEPLRRACQWGLQEARRLAQAAASVSLFGGKLYFETKARKRSMEAK